VTKLVLWDPGLFTEMKISNFGQLVQRAWGKVRRKLDALRRPGAWRTGFKLSRLTREQLMRPARWLQPRQQALETLRRQLNMHGDFASTSLRAFEAYRPPNYSGDVVLLQCWRDQRNFAALDTWKAAVKGNLKVHQFECGHGEILKGATLSKAIEITGRELARPARLPGEASVD
jgi:thioesterase domain-containing protein